MRNRQILGRIVWLLFVFVAMNPDVVSSQSAALSLDFPLTPQEQAARLRGLASPEDMRKLYASAVETDKPYYQRDDSHEWSKGSLDERISSRRRVLAEKIGEQRRAKFAAEQGWIKLPESRDRGVRQGSDAVYFDPQSGRLLALESKEGTSQSEWSDIFGLLKRASCKTPRDLGPPVRGISRARRIMPGWTCHRGFSARRIRRASASAFGLLLDLRALLSPGGLQ